MAVKHVTIYECDVCKAHVGAKGLTAVKIGTLSVEVCGKCLLKVESALGLDLPEAAEPHRGAPSRAISNGRH